VTLDHPIFSSWPARYPDRLQLFSLPTPNGVKVGIMLEETRFEYEPHRIDILADESHDPAFLALNPNGKIPAIYDPDGPSGAPLALFESGAILLYLADKTGQFISSDPNTRYETIQWVMWQMGGVGPMFGQVGFFNKFAGKAYEDKRPRDRYATESARLLGVLDERLAGRDWVMGADYSSSAGCAQFDRLLRSARACRLRPLSSCAGVAQPWPRASGGAARAESDGGLGRVCLRLMRGVIRERTRRRGFRLLANELARRESLDLT
jgi:GST-like protein